MGELGFFGNQLTQHVSILRSTNRGYPLETLYRVSDAICSLVMLTRMTMRPRMFEYTVPPLGRDSGVAANQ
jgi:hypothetical protein